MVMRFLDVSDGRRDRGRRGGAVDLRAPGRAPQTAYFNPTTRSARLVPVGPQRINAPAASRTGYASLRSRPARASAPIRTAVSPSMTAPAASVGPSTPSLAYAIRGTPACPATARAADRA